VAITVQACRNVASLRRQAPSQSASRDEFGRLIRGTIAETNAKLIPSEYTQSILTNGLRLEGQKPAGRIGHRPPPNRVYEPARSSDYLPSREAAASGSGYAVAAYSAAIASRSTVRRGGAIFKTAVLLTGR
jgi:hypothetical protein